jgi:imidazolonepropionase-like amidohydrolase
MCRSILVVCSALLLHAVPCHGEPLVITGAGVIDVEKGTLIPKARILLDGGSIQAVGVEIDVPLDAEIIDVGDGFLAPGLFETHTHMLLSTQQARDNGRFFFTNVIETTAYRAIQGTANARSMLEAGFTTIRDLGNNGNYGDVDLKRAIREGWTPGPDMQVVGRIIAPFGGQFKLQPERPELIEPEYLIADTTDELRKAVRQNIHYGADVIKLIVDDVPYFYTEEDIRVVVEEAERAGVKVAVHIATDQGARNAIAAGVHSLEHAFDLEDDTLRAMAEKGIYLVGTDFPEGHAGYFANYNDELADDLYRQRIDRLTRAYDMGVPIAFGADVTDYLEGRTRGGMTMEFIESFKDAGVEPEDMLRIMTINAADLMGLKDVKGSIVPGKQADIIAFRENPLGSMDALYDVTFVMKAGVVYVRDGEFVWQQPSVLNIE